MTFLRLAALLLSLSATFAHAIEDGLVGYWSFDEGNGDAVADLSGQGHNGTFAYGQPEWVDGKTGSALFFDGDSGVEIPDFYGINGSTPRTIAFWIKSDETTNAGGATVLVGFGFHDSGRRWHVKYEGTAEKTLRTENQGGNNWGADPINDNEWHHVASVLPEGGTTIGDVIHYIDGVAQPVSGSGGQTVDTSTDPDEGAVPVTFGTGFLSPATQRWAVGTMDDVAMWDRELSQEEIQSLVDGAIPIAQGDPALVTSATSSLGQVTSVPPTHEGSFTVRNLGEGQTLTVSEITSSNPDRFTVTDFPSSLAPGASGEVTYLFDSKGESGGFSSVLSIMSNSEQEPVKEVRVSASVINKQGPVARYRFDEAEGSTKFLDTSGFDRHGTIPDGVAQLGVSPVAGEKGTALALNGSGPVTVPIGLFDPFETMSVSAWIQLDDANVTQTLFGIGVDTPDVAVLLQEGGVAWYVDGEPRLVSDPALTSGQKHHVAVSFATDALVLYLDGVAVAQEDAPEALPDVFEGNLSIGAIGTAVALVGSVDEFQIYDRAIDAGDVTSLFNNPTQTLGDLVAVDSDGDGLSDAEEVDTHMTDPLLPDTDGDGLEDGAEVDANANPLIKDTDGGGAWDGFEVAGGSDPTVAEDDPAVWTTHTIRSGAALRSLADAEAMIAGGTGTETGGQHLALNFLGTGGSAGNFDEDAPFDNQTTPEQDVNEFAVVASTQIFVNEAGTYSLGFNSDDGARLTVSGIVVGEFTGTRGTADTIGSVQLFPGFHDVDFVYFEGTGGSAVEVFWDEDPGDPLDSFDSSRFELLRGTTVIPVDSDGDGLDDNWENAIFGDLAQDGSGDADSDGLTDFAELELSTNPLGEDSDGDGLADGFEVNTSMTLPLIADTDGDQRSDGEEVNGNPTSDPLDEDTDNDSFRDGFEVAQNSDPNNPASLPADRLGEPGLTFNEPMALPTFDNFRGGEDKQDVTFRAFIDFDAKTDDDGRDMIWESGGGTVGFAIVYETGSKLVLRAAGNGGNTVSTVEYALTEGQIAAGELEVVWTFDVDNGDPATGQTIALYLDGELVGEDSANMDPDWTGANGAAFAVASTSFAAGGGNTALGDSIDFAAGTINVTKGLQYFPNQLFPGNDRGPTPVDPNLAIESVTLSADGMLEITFSSEANATYDIEASNDLERGFISILEVVGTATTTTATVPSDNLPERFYRVRLR
jgi:hypothetical protein